MLQDDAIPKAPPKDVLGRYREVVSDPVNLLIRRDKWAGLLREGRIVLLNGNRVPVDGPGSYYGTFGHVLVINRGVHEPLEEFVFQEMLKVMPEAPVMIELGAYWAHYSMWMMKERPKATTIMVEPNEDNLEGGRENYAQNGYRGEFIRAFVSADDWMLDKFVVERGMTHIDVLHVDIQGYEIDLVDKSPNALGGHVADYIFISTHSQGIHRHVTSVPKFHGYRIEADSDFAATTSYDGLIFAASPNAKPIFRDLRPFSRLELAGVSPEEVFAQLEAIRAAIVNR